MDIDLTLALAVLRTGARHDPEQSPVVYPGIVDGAVIASVLTVLAGLSVSRLVGTVGPHATTGVRVAFALVALTTVGLVVVWGVIGTAVRAGGRAGVDAQR